MSLYNILPARDMITTGTLVVCLVAFYVAYKIIRQSTSRLPPGPIGLPVIGNIITVVASSVRGEHPHDLMTRLANKYGKVFSLGFGSSTRIVVLNDFACVSEAYRNQDITGRPANDVIIRGIGAHGVLNSSGETWKHQRRFSLSVFRSFGVGKRSFEDRIIDEVDFLSQEITALNGSKFNPKHYLMNATSNIICSVIFGDRYNYNDVEFKRILSILDSRIQLVGSGGLILFVPLLRLFSPGTVKKAVKIVKDQVEYFKTIVTNHKFQLASTNECNDFIDLYLKEIEKNQHQPEADDFIDDKHLLALIDSLFLAGTETSSNTLGWCLLYMAENSDVQKRIQEEITSVCGERTPSFADQQNMPYTEAVILEVQRLHTIVPLGVPHCANKDTTIRGYEIPEGSVIISNLWGVLHDPEVWSDPNVFKPERFLGRDGQVDLPKEWIPFSTGRRVCLGERLAKMEIFVFLTHLLNRYTFKKPENKPSTFEGRSGATFSPLTYHVTASPRN
ncbi:cytochrome P450 2J4-like [Amphiura filiformis]|uniref:cytochrome P450 2J4-like n=1 Tax=Amphiura filiformis TaxID=82378 RepID=UPI003B215666